MLDKKEKVILIVQSCWRRFPEQLLLGWTGCFYWLFRNSLKRLPSLNCSHTLTVRHWECHWQLPRNPVADSNLHKLFCILAERNRSSWSIFLSLYLFPYLLPAHFFWAWEIRRRVCAGRSRFGTVCSMALYSTGFTTPKSAPWMEIRPHHWGFSSHSPLKVGFWCSHEVVQRPHHCSRESLPHFLFCSPN